jgi:hypothetical protein
MWETLESRRMMSVTATYDTYETSTLVEEPAPVVEETTVELKLMGEILSNVSKTRSEISMTFARNSRA